MSNIFKNILNSFERNNKKQQINNSGSTKNSRKEKIRSGQAFLYQRNGMESEVMEITFFNNVSGAMLNQALIETMSRYPYLNTKLVELDGDFYIVKNDISIIAKRTKKLAKLGHISCGHHLLDITYFDKTIYVSWHHALCDGKGIKPFIETLIYYYCQLRYRSKASSKGIRLAHTNLLENETTEPFLEKYIYDEKKAFMETPRDAYAIPENIVEEHETDYRYEIQFSSNDFIKICKENNATPVIMTSLLMSSGIATLYPDFDKPINANIAVDIRDALNLPNTFKNCVRSMPLPFYKEFLNEPISKQAKIQREILNAQRDTDYCRKLANSSLMMFDKLDSLNNYNEKQEMMDFFNGMLINTYVISYLGQIVLNENDKYIDKMGFYNSGAAGLGITMLSCGDKFCINFKQSFENSKYVDIFCEKLKELGIEFIASEKIAFTTPRDQLLKREC